MVIRLVFFYEAWAIPVANDHYGGDGKRAKTHGYWRK
jgi:hypothetical protein|nr:MAG TPA: hypothetical protein [Caudoviricetes sp.]